METRALRRSKRTRWSKTSVGWLYRRAGRSRSAQHREAQDLNLSSLATAQSREGPSRSVERAMGRRRHGTRGRSEVDPSLPSHVSEMLPCRELTERSHGYAGMWVAETQVGLGMRALAVKSDPTSIERKWRSDSLQRAPLSFCRRNFYENFPTASMADDLHGPLCRVGRWQYQPTRSNTPLHRRRKRTSHGPSALRAAVSWAMSAWARRERRRQPRGASGSRTSRRISSATR